MDLQQLLKINWISFKCDPHSTKNSIINITPKNEKEYNIILHLFAMISKVIGFDDQLYESFENLIQTKFDISKGGIISMIKFYVHSHLLEKAYEVLIFYEAYGLRSVGYIYLLESYLSGKKFEEAHLILSILHQKYILDEKDLLSLFYYPHDNDTKNICMKILFKSCLSLSLQLWNKLKDSYKYVSYPIIENKCQKCGQELFYLKFTLSERRKILNNIGASVQNFDNFLKDKKFDFVLDGANIGMYENHGKFTWNRIYQIERLLRDKKLLLILSRKYKNIPVTLPDNILVYFTPRNVYDDLYWIYALVYYNILGVSNDKLSDIKALDNELITKLSNYKLCRINLTYSNQIKLSFPSLPIQRENESLHMPYGYETFCVKDSTH